MRYPVVSLLRTGRPSVKTGLRRLYLVLGVASTFLLAACALPMSAFAGWALTNLSFVDASHGWATGESADPSSFAVLKTVDSGASWTVQKSSGAFNGTGLDVQFVDRSRGIWVNSYVYLTTDGGAHWKPLNFPGSWGGGTFVDFASPTSVWIAGTYGSDGTGRCVARSTTGGRRWQTCLSQGTAPGGSPSSLSAPSSSTAYIWSRGLMVTRNGGVTWSRVKTGYPMKKNAWWTIDFPALKTGWAVRSGGSSMLRTTDGGKHWVKQVPAPGLQLNDMDFISKRTGWVVGAAGAVFGTVDGGASWRDFSIPNSGDLISVDFTDALHGWVATAGAWGESNSIYRTVDGGLHWEQASENPTKWRVTRPPTGSSPDGFPGLRLRHIAM